MKKTYQYFVIFLFHFFAVYESRGQVQPYLPEIVTQFPNVRDIAISPDGQEIYFTAQSLLGEISAIISVKKEKTQWSKPEVASFSGQYQDLEPAFSPDGLQLFFVSNRPLNESSKTPKDHDIWVLERKDKQSAWSAPRNLGAPVNTFDNEFYPSVADSKNLYFTSDCAKSKGKDDIFVSRWSNGKYETPAIVSDSVNTGGYEFNAFVSPDESFLLYTCYNKQGGFGSGDLYVSYKTANNSWTAPQNLGEKINSPQMDYCPWLDRKSGILYFTSKRTEVKTNFDKPQTVKDLQQEMNRYENGQSRLYWVNLEEVMQKK